MTRQSIKYPSRANTLALFKARDKNPGGPAAPRLSAAGVAHRPEAPVCYGFASPR